MGILNGLSLCSGVGGLELGISLAVPGYRTVCYVEREAYAAAVLVARMEDKALDAAPIWDDLATFDGRPWRGVVGLITAGIPCQPYSVAGRGEGHADERAVWPEFVRIVEECRPALVFIENVPAFARWFREPGERLCELGYEIQDPLFLAAEDIGAPHKRERVFILAHSNQPGLEGHDPTGRPVHEELGGFRGTEGPTPQGGTGVADAPGVRFSGHREDARADSRSERQSEGCGLPESPGRGGALADPPSDLGRTGECGKEAGVGTGGEWGRRPTGEREDVADPQCQQSGQPEGRESQQWRWSPDGLPLFPPGPQDPDLWARVLAEAPTLEPALCRVANELAYRVDRLRACGNGVVPLVAAVAFLALTARAGIT